MVLRFPTYYSSISFRRPCFLKIADFLPSAFSPPEIAVVDIINIAILQLQADGVPKDGAGAPEEEQVPKKKKKNKNVAIPAAISFL